MSLARAAAVVLTALVLAACVSTGPDRRSDGAGSSEEAARINTDLGIGYFRQGRTEMALERLERAVEQDSRYPRAYAALAVIYQQIGETDKAERAFRSALRLSGRDPDLQNSYAVFLCNEGRYREADDFFNRAARDRLYATPEVALTNAGVCMREQGKTEQAEAYFRSALERNPRFPDALMQMTSLSLQADNLMGARAFLQRYFAAAPVSAEALWMGVQVERALGDLRTAGEYASRLREDFADSAQTRELLESERDGR
ncbi:MAG: type IV pilus biogenesis/stability protein PilW [Gammaproteobacteria bacterium]|nr:type IV pilus biogenesis/stability protein PilW [Gammaproteobacteria bacterium]